MIKNKDDKVVINIFELNKCFEIIDLYKPKQEPNNKPSMNSFNKIKPSMLSEEMKDSLDVDITEKEAITAISMLKSNKATGADGYLAKF